MEQMIMQFGRKTCRSAAVGFAALVWPAFALLPAEAQVGDQIVAASKTSKGKPVEIEADSMEVRQDKKQAVFSGKVDATKGNVNMRSKTLVVDYADVGGKREITFLNARGDVVVVSKGQTVKAQWAKMDVKANTVVMGDQVTVIDGKSVIRGRRLEMNLTTGQSKLVGGRVQGKFFQ